MKRMQPTRRTFLLAVGLILGSFATAVQADPNFPDRPIRMVVPFAAGSGTEIAARYFGAKMTELTGKPVVIEPRGGGNGIIGVQAVLSSPRDGYTLLYGTASTLATNVALIKNLPYDPMKDLIPVSLTMRSPIVVVVPSTSGQQSLKDLVDATKRGNGELTIGTGSPNYQLVAVLLAEKMGVKLMPVPYKSAPDSVRAVASGDVAAAVADIISAMPLISSGRARPLAVVSGKRLPTLPDVPTAVELGFEGFTHAPWNGAAAPAGTPPDVVAKLSQLFTKISAMPETQEFFAKQSAEVLPPGQEAMRSFMREEIDRWKRVADAAKMELK